MKNIFQILLKAQRKEQYFFVSTDSRSLLTPVKAKILAVRPRSEKIRLELDQDGIFSIKKMITGSRKVYLVDENHFFSFVAEILELTSDGQILLGRPLHYKFYERRQYPRAKVGKSAYIDLKSFLISSRSRPEAVCEEIGGGGLSFILPKSHIKNLAPKKESIPFTLYLGEIHIKIRAKIITKSLLQSFVHEDYPYGGLRISISYDKIKEADRKIILNYMTKMATQSA